MDEDDGADVTGVAAGVEVEARVIIAEGAVTGGVGCFEVDGAGAADEADVTVAVGAVLAFLLTGYTSNSRDRPINVSLTKLWSTPNSLAVAFLRCPLLSAYLLMSDGGVTPAASHLPKRLQKEAMAL